MIRRARLTAGGRRTTRTALAGATLLILESAGAMAQSPPPLLAEACSGCHGQVGQGQGNVPKIAGYDRAAFVDVWGQFRENKRPASIMNRIARGYTDAEVATLADYFSKLK